MKDKNSSTTVILCFFYPLPLEAFTETLYLTCGLWWGLNGGGKQHKSGSLLHLAKLPFYPFERKQKGKKTYLITTLKCYDCNVCSLVVLPYGTESVLGGENATFILEGSQLRQREHLKLGQRLEAATLSTCERNS